MRLYYIAELQFCVNVLIFNHTETLKKLTFLHKIVRLNNSWLRVFFSVCKRSIEFNALSYEYDDATDQCFLILM